MSDCFKRRAPKSHRHLCRFATMAAVSAIFLWSGIPAFAGTYNYAEALQKSIYFYECQQAGSLPDWNRVAWRGNSCLSDGSDVSHDLTGGWFDAGDHVKFNFPMASTVTVLSWGVVEFKEGFAKSGQLDHIKRNIRFACDYLLKCHTSENELYGQVGNGGTDHAFWGPAESVEYQMERPAYKINAANPGSDLAGETAAALAAAAMVFKESDAAYAQTLVNHAKQLYTFADVNRGKYSDAITDAGTYYRSWSGYNDELVWGALWLYRATGEQSYLTKATTYYANLGTEPQSTIKSYKWSLAWDDKSYGCYVLMAQLTNTQQYHDDARRWLAYWTTGYEGQKIAYTPGGLAWLDQWGANRYAANTAFCALVYANHCGNVNLAGTYRTFAQNQINYMLGDNPNNRSMVVGFGVNPPQRPHHRTCHGYYPSQSSDTTASRHILYGALVGGPNLSDAYVDDRNNYINNEVACDYNGCFTGALAALVDTFGGTALSVFPLPVSTQPELMVHASINVDGDRFTEIKAVLYNQTAWPARGVAKLSFRYFVDLSEVVSAGMGPQNITINKNYAQGSPTISNLQVWDASKHLYYVEVAFGNEILYPGTHDSYKREVQFRLALPDNAQPSAWDPSNDWSCTDLQVGYSNQKLSPKIPVYENGTLVYGTEPGRGTVGSAKPVKNALGSHPLPALATDVNYYTITGRRLSGTMAHRLMRAQAGVYVQMSQGTRVWFINHTQKKNPY